MWPKGESEGDNDDTVVLESTDPACFLDVAHTKDWRYITLNLNTKTESEVHSPFLHRHQSGSAP